MKNWGLRYVSQSCNKRTVIEYLGFCLRACITHVQENCVKLEPVSVN